jgi:hypothetical protein
MHQRQSWWASISAALPVLFHIATRRLVLTCRKCRRQTGLTVGAVVERSYAPLSIWFWAAYLIAGRTPGTSVQIQVSDLPTSGFRGRAPVL